MNNPFLSSDQISGRIVAGGKITSLASAFSLANGQMFSIFLVPTSGTGTTEVLTVKLPGNASSVDMPFLVEEWSPILLTEVSADNSILSDYDIYWGSGVVASV